MSTQSPLHTVYSTMASRLGVECESVNNDMLRMESHNLTFAIVAEDDDPSFMKLFIGCERPPEWADDALAWKITQSINKGIKCVKMRVEEDAVIAAVEMLVSPPSCLPTVGHLCAVVPRATRILHDAFVKFNEEMTLSGIAAASAAAEENS